MDQFDLENVRNLNQNRYPYLAKKEVFVIMNMASGEGNSLKDKKKSL